MFSSPCFLQPLRLFLQKLVFYSFSTGIRGWVFLTLLLIRRVAFCLGSVAKTASCLLISHCTLSFRQPNSGITGSLVIYQSLLIPAHKNQLDFQKFCKPIFKLQKLEIGHGDNINTKVNGKYNRDFIFFLLSFFKEAEQEVNLDYLTLLGENINPGKRQHSPASLAVKYGQ